MTLIELVLYMVIAATLAAAAFLLYRPGDITARYQAERLRIDLRHAQMVALTQQRALRVSVSGNAYKVTADCVSGSPVGITDPATNAEFSVSLDAALAFSGPASLDFDALGRPGACSGNPCASCAQAGSAATYTVAGGGTTYTISVQPGTGFAALSP